MSEGDFDDLEDPRFPYSHGPNVMNVDSPQTSPTPDDSRANVALGGSETNIMGTAWDNLSGSTLVDPEDLSDGEWDDFEYLSEEDFDEFQNPFEGEFQLPGMVCRGTHQLIAVTSFTCQRETSTTLSTSQSSLSFRTRLRESS